VRRLSSVSKRELSVEKVTCHWSNAASQSYNLVVDFVYLFFLFTFSCCLPFLVVYLFFSYSLYSIWIQLACSFSYTVILCVLHCTAIEILPIQRVTCRAYTVHCTYKLTYIHTLRACTRNCAFLHMHVHTHLEPIIDLFTIQMCLLLHAGLHVDVQSCYLPSTSLITTNCLRTIAGITDEWWHLLCLLDLESHFDAMVATQLNDPKIGS